MSDPLDESTELLVCYEFMTNDYAGYTRVIPWK